MLLAYKNLGNRDRIRVTAKKQYAYCPGCSQEVISKCGTKKIWHWAHKARGGCDWYSSESEWHRLWKALFPNHCIEVFRGKHRADAIDSVDRVWEFQNSYLPKEEIDARELFHDNLLWIWHVKEKQKLITFDRWQSGICYRVVWWKWISSYRRDEGEKLFENYEKADDFRDKMTGYGWKTDLEVLDFIDFRQGKRYQAKDVSIEYETNQKSFYSRNLHTVFHSPQPPLWLPKQIRGLPSRWWWQHASMAQFCNKPVLLELEEDLFFAISKMYRNDISTYTDPEYGIRLQYDALFTEGILFRLSKKYLIRAFEDASISQMTLF
jgi:hypothetical protein